MKDEEIKQFINDKAVLNKAWMREVHMLIEKLKEAGESDVIGSDSGWTYTFKRDKEKTKQELT